MSMMLQASFDGHLGDNFLYSDMKRCKFFVEEHILCRIEEDYVLVVGSRKDEFVDKLKIQLATRSTIVVLLFVPGSTNLKKVQIRSVNLFSSSKAQKLHNEEKKNF